jgi:hypothetical protein
MHAAQQEDEESMEEELEEDRRWHSGGWCRARIKFGVTYTL